MIKAINESRGLINGGIVMDPETTKVATEIATKVAKEAYNDAAKPVMQSTGGVLALIPRAINAALLPLHNWIAHREYQIEETKKLLSIKLANVKPEEIVPPEPHVAIPALQAISYSMDNDEIRNMYANLLAASMTQTIKGGVHPAYVEFIKQMSPDEARILRYIYLNTGGVITVVTLRSANSQNEGIDIVPYFTTLYRVVEGLESRSPNKTAVFVDNLIRLKLLQMHDGNFLSKAGIYDSIENDPALDNVKNHFNHQAGFSWKYERTYFSITSLGKSFCKICLGV